MRDAETKEARGTRRKRGGETADGHHTPHPSWTTHLPPQPLRAMLVGRTVGGMTRGDGAGGDEGDGGDGVDAARPKRREASFGPP